jgi:uroporphyrinogen decarboxylase
MDVISKKQFDRFSLPYLKKLIDGTEKIMGIRPGAHICGKTEPIWNDLADAGLFSFSVDNCEDLAQAKEEVGDRMRIAGNVPPITVMKDGTIDDVIASCRECLLKCADSPSGFILNTGCQLPIGTPKKNVDAFIYATRKYGRGARIGQMPKGILEEK